MIKRIVISIGVIILIPALVYLFLSIGNDIIIETYIGYYHINIYSITKPEMLNILNHRIYYGTAIGEFLSVVLLLVIFLIPKEGLIKRCKFKKIDIKKLPIILTFIIGFVFITIVFVHLTQEEIKSYLTIEKEMELNSSSLLGIILLTLLIPILEEIIFRGAIFTALKNQMHWVMALIIQAIIFSLMHGNLLQSIYTFPLGIILGFAFIYTGSLFGNIICHITFNLFGMILIPLLGSLYYNPILYIIIGVVLMLFSLYLYCKEKQKHTLSLKY